MLDVFKADSFSTLSLTSAIDKLPYKPSRLGQMNLFQEEGITTTVALIEEREGKLTLIPNQARATFGNVASGVTRKTRAFPVTNLPLVAEVFAEDVQNIRAFGEDDVTETVNGMVNDKLQMLRQSMEYTHEWHRLGAIKGILLDADNTTTIYNWCQEFLGTTIATDAMTFTGETSNAIKKCAARIIRRTQDSLGAATYDHIHVMCGATFFDNVIASIETKTAYDRWRDGQFLRDAQVRQSFEFAGVTWEEYRGKFGGTGGTPFIPLTEAYAFPVGAPDLFKQVNAPAPFAETVNSKGKRIYVKQERMEFDIGIKLLALSCPLIYCARPAALTKISQTGAPPTS